MNDPGIRYQIDKNGKLFIYTGPTAEPLHKQLDVPPSKAEKLQKDANAISHLWLEGLLTDRETHLARKRLVKKIEKEFVK